MSSAPYRPSAWYAGMVVAVALTAGGQTVPETTAARQWFDSGFALSVPATPSPAPPGLRVLHASHKVLLNRTVWGEPLRLGDRTLEHGIYADAPARLRVTLARPAAQFEATVGIDRNANSQRGAAEGHGCVRFAVAVGGQAVFSTPVLRPADPPQPVQVALNGATEFDLVLDDAGDRAFDQADWGDAAVVCEDGSRVYLDALGLAPAGQPRVPPFSFVYGGRPSAELLPTWERSAREEPAAPGGPTERVVQYRDPATGLVCEARARAFADVPAVEWVLSFRNDGQADTPVLEAVRTLDAVWPLAAEQPVTLRRNRGSDAAATDFQPIVDPLAAGAELGFAPTGGRSSNGVLPFFTVQHPGGGVCVAVGWSGQWRAAVRRADGLGVQVGLECLRARLRPGECIRVTRVLLVFWDGPDPQRGHNLYRQAFLRYCAPRLDGQPVLPLIAHDTAYDELRNTNERNQLQIIEATRAAGLEAYWLDAYWFEGYFPDGVGNWAMPIEQTVRRRDFPNGLRPLADACHQAGLKFVLWFEPERVAPGTHLDRTRAPWVLRIGGRPGGLLNLGDAEARQWLTDYLCQCLEAYRVDVLRIDFNIDPLPYWLAHDPPDRQGLTEVGYVTGLYDLWDTIRRRFPAIFIDNCASGGRRIDLETNTRSIPMWRSDYNDSNVTRGDAVADQGMVLGLTPFVPVHAGPVWGSDPYRWRSANVAGPIPYWDLRGDDAQAREQCRRAVREAQELRPFALGDFWLLTANSVDPQAWAGFQFHRPQQDDGYACFFRRAGSPYPALEVSLRGVEPDQAYELDYRYGFESDRRQTLSGRDLQAWRVEIPKPGSSLLVRYRRVAR